MKTNTIKAKITTNWQQKTLDNKRHIVAPVVLLTEGVHSGSAGPIYYPREELQNTAHLWNGRPISVYHPNEQGMPVSANSPSIQEQQNIGQVFNVIYEEVNGIARLRGEAWVDVEKGRRLSPETMHFLDNNLPGLEVSTGLFSDDEIAPGEWNGESYNMIARNHRPDHLASLPGQTGACSWSDGCGIRNNKEEGKKMNSIGILLQVMKDAGINEDDVDLSHPSTIKNTETVLKKHGIFINELSYGDKRQIIQQELDSMDQSPPQYATRLYHYARDIFEDYVIYNVESDAGSELYKRSYTIDETENKVTFSDEIQKVVEKTEYIPVENQKAGDGNGGQGMSKVNKKDPCCPDKVAALIANEDSKWTEEDVEFLNTLTANQLENMEPVIVEKEVIKEVEVKANEKKPETMEEYIAEAPEEMREVLQSGVDMHRNKKSMLVSNIIALKRNQFTEVQLKEKAVGELEMLLNLGKAPVYNGNGANSETHIIDNVEEEEPLEMPDMMASGD